MNRFTLTTTGLLVSVALSTGSRDKGPGVEVKVPIEIVDPSSIIKIHVNGHPVPVLFDLGNADGVSLFPAFLEGVDKKKIGETGGRKSLYGPEEGKPIYRVENVDVGSIRFTDLDVVEDFHNGGFQAKSIEAKGAYGFVGSEMFVGYKLIIDYQNNELTIISTDARGIRQSARYGRESPLMAGSNSDVGALTPAKTEIGGVRFVWDTGAPANIILKARTDAANLGLPEFAGLTLDELSFGAHNFAPASFYVRDFNIPPFDGPIGYPLFKVHVICIDLPAGRLYVH